MNTSNSEHLSTAIFTVIDLETTGSVKPENTIIEVSAIKVQNRNILDEFTTLINPEQPISYFISQYTGITNDMVKHSPPVREIVPKLRAFIGKSIFVAHNVVFDLGFVNQESCRHGFEKLDNASLCTVRLARRLLPKNQRKNLGELSAYFGIQIKDRHRARGDCYATVLVLQELIELAKSEYHIESIDELLSLQFQSMRKFNKEPRHVKVLRRDFLPNIPESPGVYLMHSAKGDLLYIGKSKNLKARVSSYFTPSEGKSDKVRELSSSIRKVDFKLTGSELEALLLESRLIKKFNPPYNSLLRHYRTYPFLKLTNHEYPKLEIATEVKSDGAEYFGPFSSRDTVNDVFDVLNKNFLLRECLDEELKKGRACLYRDLSRCTAPCEPDEYAQDRYEVELTRVRKFLSGEDAEIIDVLSEKMKKLAVLQKYEDAAELKGKIQSLRRVFYRQSNVTASVNENNAMIFLPSENFSDVCKEFLVLFIRYGRLASQCKIFADDALSLSQYIESIYYNGESAPEECRKEEIDEMQILSSWIYQNRETLSVLYIREGNSIVKILDETIERLTKLSLNQTELEVVASW